MNFLRRFFRSKQSSPQPTGKNYPLAEALERIRRCPWKEDITVERCSFIANGSYGLVKGKTYHTVSISADGPNPDGSMHHAFIGHWGDLETIQAANELAISLFAAVQVITGCTPPVYWSRKDRNSHAAWSMSERPDRPVGVDPSQLPDDMLLYLKDG